MHSSGLRPIASHHLDLFSANYGVDGIDIEFEIILVGRCGVTEMGWWGKWEDAHLHVHFA